MKHYIFIIITTVLCTSCEDYLTPTPSDFLNPKVYYKTEEQLDAGLRTIYRCLATYSLYGNYLQYELALYADEGLPRQAPFTNVRWNDVSASDATIRGFWTQLYQSIDQVNYFLENIDRKDIAMSTERRNEMKGEALFLRSYYYFLLVQQFGPIPFKTTSSQELDDAFMERTPIDIVYNQIWDDLIIAESLLTPIDQIGFGGKVSKSAAQGLLARVALFMASRPLLNSSKWADAKYWASKVINSGLHELNPDYEQIFINYAQDKYDYKESIFEAEMFGSNEPPYVNAGRVGMNIGGPTYLSKFPENTKKYGLTYGFVKGVNWLYLSYPDGDVRRDRNIANYYYDQNTGEMKFYRETLAPNASAFSRFARKWDRRDEEETSRNRANSPQNFPVLRYADVLLMFAEANNEINGNADSTYLCVNMVRRRGVKQDVTQANTLVDLPLGLSQSDLRDEIRVERSKELCYESLRKGDLVRWGIYVEKMHAMITEIEGTTWANNAAKAFYSNVSARDTLWPIPEYERNLNKRLTQNPGW